MSFCRMKESVLVAKRMSIMCSDIQGAYCPEPKCWARADINTTNNGNYKD
jgi:hypothetical protein